MSVSVIMSSGNGTSGDTNELPTGNKVIEVIILCIIIVVSVLGNGSLWIVVLRSRALRTLTSMFILGLSMAGKSNLNFNSIFLVSFMPLSIFP